MHKSVEDSPPCCRSSSGHSQYYSCSNDFFSSSFVQLFQQVSALGEIAITSVNSLTPSDVPYQLQQLIMKDSGVRIFVFVGNVSDLKKIWPVANSLELTSLLYVWISTDADPGYASSSIDGEFLGMLGIKTYFDPSNSVYQSFLTRWQQRLQADSRLTFNISSPASFSAFQYDAVWAVARTIKSMMPIWDFGSSNETYKLALRQRFLATLHTINF